MAIKAEEFRMSLELPRRSAVQISSHVASVTHYPRDDMTMISPFLHPTQSCPPTTMQSSGSLSPGIGMA